MNHGLFSFLAKSLSLLFVAGREEKASLLSLEDRQVEIPGGQSKEALERALHGCYRKDDLIPIVMRNVEIERKNIGRIAVMQIQPAFSTTAAPLSQLTNGVKTEREDPIIRRRDRRRRPIRPCTGSNLQQFKK
jgi:hypothetical protein